MMRFGECGCQDFDAASEGLVLALFSEKENFGCARSLTATIKTHSRTSKHIGAILFWPRSL